MSDFVCQACGVKEFPSFVMNAKSKLIAECTRCQWQDPSRGPSDFGKGLAAMPSGAGATSPGWGGKNVVVVDLNPARPDPRQAPTAVSHTPVVAPGYAPYAALGPAPAVPAITPGDVLSWIEQRAMWLAAEEARIEGDIAAQRARLAGVKAEQKRLMRMMRAGRRDEAREPQDARPPTQTTLEAVEH